MQNNFIFVALYLVIFFISVLAKLYQGNLVFEGGSLNWIFLNDSILLRDLDLLG